MMNTDVPYLQPLLFHLRDDAILKQHFTDRSYFMPKNDLVSAIDEAIKNDCPAPRALWILPQETVATNPKPGCKSPGRHSFYITIITQCIRDAFELYEIDGELTLKGQYMELAMLRQLVKDSIQQFSKKTFMNAGFMNVTWVRDQMLYPDEQEQFLVTTLQYEVTITK